jgi:hypothetical protein
MAADNLSTRSIAEQIHQETSQRIATKSRGIQPGLAFVRVGRPGLSGMLA